MFLILLPDQLLVTADFNLHGSVDCPPVPSLREGGDENGDVWHPGRSAPAVRRMRLDQEARNEPNLFIGRVMRNDSSVVYVSVESSESLIVQVPLVLVSNESS